MKPFVNFYQSDLVPEPARFSPVPLPSTILVVNRNAALREYLRNTLNGTYRIEEAGDENDGLRLAKQILPDLGKKKNATSEKAKRLLGWNPRSVEDAIVASADSLLSLGLLKA